MYWRELTKEAAESAYDQFLEDGNIQCPEAYKELRQDLCKAFSESLKILGISEDELDQKNNSYMLDLVFGLILYETLNNKYDFCVRLAATDGIWRHLAVCVAPDLTAKRYNKDHEDHPDRFWKKPKRIWLRVLWWYIYLSWQGSQTATFNALKDNSTDEILQLVDRCGRGGYRTELYREVIRQHALQDPSERRRKQMFRKVLKLNTARTQVVEPSLFPGSNEGYVSHLIAYFN